MGGFCVMKRSASVIFMDKLVRNYHLNPRPAGALSLLPCACRASPLCGFLRRHGGAACTQGRLTGAQGVSASPPHTRGRRLPP